MKKLLLKLVTLHFKDICTKWSELLSVIFGNKLTESQIKTFVDGTLKIFIEITEKAEYEIADNYLIEIYNLFSSTNLNLLEVSQVFTNGRFAILTNIENDPLNVYDPVVLMSYIEEVVEQLYARYVMLHQEARMKEVLADRDRLASKLEINQQYLQNILHSTDSAILVIDENEKFSSWSAGVEKIFGYTEKEVIGKPSTLLIPNEPKYLAELERIRKTVKEIGFIKISDTERINKAGDRIPVQLNVAKLPGTSGRYSGRLVIIKDFSEVKRLKQQIDQSEKLAVIGQLAAGVAHEIGNPLTSISAIVQILKRKSSDPYFDEQLTMVKSNIDRIAKIVRELVDFSRPPGHEKAIVQIADVIKTAIGIVKYDKRVKKVQFSTDIDPNLPLINIVPDQILQVFVNILFNALDAMNGTGLIELSAKYDDENIYITIKDTGTGIESGIIKNIFDPFFTTKEVGKGTGLGLSVSYGIVKKFHGDIFVESEINKGSKFTLKLPYTIENN